jgi:hypothetical protein
MLIGFPIDTDLTDFRHFTSLPDFPDKVGGLPVWLAPVVHSPLACSGCNSNPALLLQLYCPRSDYHRVIYVFICRSNHCQKILVLRSQLPISNNEYYTPAGEIKTSIPSSLYHLIIRPILCSVWYFIFQTMFRM